MMNRVEMNENMMEQVNGGKIIDGKYLNTGKCVDLLGGLVHITFDHSLNFN